MHHPRPITKAPALLNGGAAICKSETRALEKTLQPAKLSGSGDGTPYAGRHYEKLPYLRPDWPGRHYL